MTWYAIRSATRQEAKAEASLRELGLQVYLPRETREWKHARKVEPRLYPLLTDYLFADFGPDDVTRVLRADGVCQILGPPTDMNRRGQPVPEVGLAWLGAIEHMGGFNRIKGEPEPTYSPGRLVRVRSGKLSGAIGEIVESKGKGRFWVLIDYFGRMKRVDLERTHLEVAA